VNEVFKQLTGLGKASAPKHLLQAPFTLHDRMLELVRAETVAAKAGRKVPEVGATPAAASRQTATPGKVPPEAQPAAKAAGSSGPTIEELQKELEELKAKLAAQPQQKPDAGKGTEPANQPAQEAPSPPK